MHGLVNKALESFVVETYGPSTWEAVSNAAGLGGMRFEAMLAYDDTITAAVLGAAAKHLGKPQEALLEDVGTYLVSHPDVTAPRRLLRFSGATFEEFLNSLEDLPDRVRLAIPDLSLPPMQLTELANGGYRVTCGTWFDGYGHMLVGLLQAMADEYGALVTIEHSGANGVFETVELHLHVPDFTPGRAFELNTSATA